MIDKKLLTDIRPAINDALKAVGKEFGVKITAGKARYDADTADFKLMVMRLDENGKAVTKEASDFVKYCTIYGLKPEHLNQSFELSPGDSYTIIGLKSRATKNTIVVRGSNGSDYVVPHEAVCRALGLAS